MNEVQTSCYNFIPCLNNLSGLLCGTMFLELYTRHIYETGNIYSWILMWIHGFSLNIFFYGNLMEDITKRYKTVIDQE